MAMHHPTKFKPILFNFEPILLLSTSLNQTCQSTLCIFTRNTYWIMVGKDMTRNRPLNPKTRINMQLFNGGYLQCEYLIEEKKKTKTTVQKCDKTMTQNWQVMYIVPLYLEKSKRGENHYWHHLQTDLRIFSNFYEYLTWILSDIDMPHFEVEVVLPARYFLPCRRQGLTGRTPGGIAETTCNIHDTSISSA